MTDLSTYRVDPARLQHGTWNRTKDRDEGEGDISQSYSADTIATSGRVRKPFKHAGTLWICTSFERREGIEKAGAYRLIKAFSFAGKQTTYREKTGTSEVAEAARHDPMGFYHGISVTSGGESMVLNGPPCSFVADYEAHRPEAERPEPEQLGLF